MPSLHNRTYCFSRVAAGGSSSAAHTPTHPPQANGVGEAQEYLLRSKVNSHIIVFEQFSHGDVEWIQANIPL